VKLKFNKLDLSTMKIFRGAFFICVFFYTLRAENISSQTLFEIKKNSVSTEKISMNGIEPEFLLRDSVKKISSDKAVFKMQKSPWKAVAYSALLPGAGQFYNKSYWKIPIIAGLGGYFVYEWIKNNNIYLDYKEQYINSQTPQNPSGNFQLQSLREFYRDQRDNFIIYSIILYVVNIIDAYVDAQLYDFNVSDKIKLGVLKKENLLKLSYSF
jgi:Family of unknown function (DUF5683)